MQNQRGFLHEAECETGGRGLNILGGWVVIYDMPEIGSSSSTFISTYGWINILEQHRALEKETTVAKGM